MLNLNQNINGFLSENELPHNFVAEKIILSSLLISSEAMETIFRSVKVETFYFQNHQELYKNLIEMSKKQIPIDIVTLHTFLQDNGELDKIGGPHTLIDLLNHVPNLSYLEQTRAARLSFEDGEAVVTLFLKQKKSSSMNLLLGLIPSGGLPGARLTLTGLADINTQNMLGKGEFLSFKFERLLAQTQTVDLNISFPAQLGL